MTTIPITMILDLIDAKLETAQAETKPLFRDELLTEIQALDELISEAKDEGLILDADEQQRWEQQELLRRQMTDIRISE